MFDLVADEVLDRGCDAAVLNATDVCDGQLSGQYRVLREALEVPAPEGVAVQVHRWREEDPGSPSRELAEPRSRSPVQRPPGPRSRRASLPRGCRQKA